MHAPGNVSCPTPAKPRRCERASRLRKHGEFARRLERQLGLDCEGLHHMCHDQSIPRSRMSVNQMLFNRLAFGVHETQVTDWILWEHSTMTSVLNSASSFKYVPQSQR